MKKILFLLIPCIFLSINCETKTLDSRCKSFVEYYNVRNTFAPFEGAITRDITILHKKEIYGNKKDELVKYAKQINNYIINQQIDQLIDNISKKDFRTYHDYVEGFKISENISSSVITQLKNRKGSVYYFLFDRLKGYGPGENYDPQSADSLDVRSFLICFQNKISWRVLFYPRNDTYDVWFSMPSGVIDSFAFFHYVVKEENGKYILIGM
jgi:hypothetical protein